MAESLLELQDLYKESLVRDLIEKTKAVGLVWSTSGGSVFTAIQIQEMPGNSPNIEWSFILSKTQIGNLSYKYMLDAKKDGAAWVTLESGPLPYTARDSLVKELFECVEILTLQLDYKIKETIRFVQQAADARSGPTTGYEWTSG
jgi:hypothetical protein